MVEVSIVAICSVNKNLTSGDIKFDISNVESNHM